MPRVLHVIKKIEVFFLRKLWANNLKADSEKNSKTPLLEYKSKTPGHMLSIERWRKRKENYTYHLSHSGSLAMEVGQLATWHN